MEWISVGERLPQVSEQIYGGESEDVLVTDGENIAIAYWQSEYSIEDDPDAFEDQTDIFLEACWHFESTNSICYSEITHWMPLPKTPKTK